MIMQFLEFLNLDKTPKSKKIEPKEQESSEIEIEDSNQEYKVIEEEIVKNNKCIKRVTEIIPTGNKK